MSHLTTFKNNSLINTNRELLASSIAEIGLTIDFNHKNIKNTWINETVDAAFMKDGKYIAVGLRFETNPDGEEEVTVAGDFWGTGLKQEELTNRIAQVYQKNRVISVCQEANWFIEQDSIRTEENGDIVIQAYRYA